MSLKIMIMVAVALVSTVLMLSVKLYSSETAATRYRQQAQGEIMQLSIQLHACNEAVDRQNAYLEQFKADTEDRIAAYDLALRTQKKEYQSRKKEIIEIITYDKSCETELGLIKQELEGFLR